MLIADRILMLALSPDSGLLLPGVDANRLQRTLVAGLVAELAVMRRVRLDSAGNIEMSDSLPLSHPMLGETMRLLQQLGPSLPLQRALIATEQRLGDLKPRIAEVLFRRDLLHRGLRWRWWLWPQRVYPLRSRQARNECLEQLVPTDPATPVAVARRMVLALASAGGVLEALPPADRTPDLDKRGRDAVGSAISESVRDPLQALTRELARYVRG